jgi:hypothetical protein
MKSILSIIVMAAFLIVGIVGSASAAGDAVYFKPGIKVNKGAAIQGCAPSTVSVLALGTKGKVNVDTTSLTCLSVTATNGTTSTAVAIKARPGGFTTGLETDWELVPTTGRTFWVGNNTSIGFQAFSTATAVSGRVGKH